MTGLLLGGILGLLFLSLVSSSQPAARPNFIVILTDDLDETQDSSGELAMPALKRLLRNKGVTFTNHFVTTPICCPSRVNLLRGQLSHNTNFTDVLGPHGGYAKFLATGMDREWLPTWLQRGGYNTLYTGKFLVDYTILNRQPPPAGWTSFDALVHPFTFEYYCPAFSLNGGEPRMYPAQYSTDVVAAKAVAMLRSAATDPAGRPFFLQVAPPAPHHSMHYEYDSSGVLVSRHWYPPVPAARHWDELSGTVLPRPPSFNDPWISGKPAWLRGLPRLSRGNVSFLEEVFRLRLRSLRAVDELVQALVSELSSLGLASRTYVIFTSDNGYHEGAHRMGSGKTTAYEEDIRVPLVAAGPGLRPGSRLDSTTSHIDIAPTVLALAGLPLPPSLDGTPLPLAAASDGTLPATYQYGNPELGPLRNQLVAEYWGEWLEESIHSHPNYKNHTWKAVRVLKADQAEAYKYILHCNGDVELYDLVRDPYERINLLEPVAAAGFRAAAGLIRAGPGGWWAGARAAVSRVLQRQPAGEAEPDGVEAVAAPAPAADAGASGLGVAGARMAAAARGWAKTAWAVVNAAATRGSATVGRAPARGGDDDSGGGGGDVDRGGDDGSGGGGGDTDRGGARKRQLVAAAGRGEGATHGSLRADYARWLLRVRSRLDALLAVLAVCRGRACSQPFQVLHPAGNVLDLWTAMDEQYDDLYDKIKPFSFGQCLHYQDTGNEHSAFRGATVQAACMGYGGDGEAPAGAADAEGETSAGSGAGARVGGGGPLPITDSDMELAAVPLPAKYRLITDLYGDAGAQDAVLLA